RRLDAVLDLREPEALRPHDRAAPDDRDRARRSLVRFDAGDDPIPDRSELVGRADLLRGSSRRANERDDGGPDRTTAPRGALHAPHSGTRGIDRIASPLRRPWRREAAGI